jgi:hypothetical protein
MLAVLRQTIIRNDPDAAHRRTFRLLKTRA